MSQMVPLMLYKTKGLKSELPVPNLFYNYQSGLWEDESGQAVISNLFTEKPSQFDLGNTVLTRTREGVDRSEQTNY